MGLIPDNAGQPSARAAWKAARVNEPVSDFYIGTLETLENAVLRPRFAGYVNIQLELAEWLRSSGRHASASSVLAHINRVLREGAKDA